MPQAKVSVKGERQGSPNPTNRIESKLRDVMGYLFRQFFRGERWAQGIAPIAEPGFPVVGSAPKVASCKLDLLIHVRELAPAPIVETQ